MAIKAFHDTNYHPITTIYRVITHLFVLLLSPENCKPSQIQPPHRYLYYIPRQDVDMAPTMPDMNLPAGVEVARFARLTLNVGFVGGQEKEVQYDNRRQTDNGEIQYRQYIERDKEQPPKAENLKDAAPMRSVLKVLSDTDVSYTEFVGSEEKYLVTWDNGRTIRVMDPDEMMTVLRATAEREERLTPEDIPEDIPGLFSDSESKTPPAPAKGEVSNETNEVETQSEATQEPPEPVSQ